MSERIEPSLSLAEWKRYTDKASVADRGGMAAILGAMYASDETASMIALLNRELPDSDPRKVTREMVQRIRDAAYRVESEWGKGHINHPSEATDGDAKQLFADADALEAYLPPENGT